MTKNLINPWLESSTPTRGEEIMIDPTREINLERYRWQIENDGLED